MATVDIKTRLGIDIDNTKALAGIGQVKTAFDSVAGAATKADTAGGLPNTARQLSAIRSTLAGFRQTLVAYAGLRVIGSIIGDIAQRIDTFTLLDARVKAAAGSVAKAADAYKRLGQISKETSVPIADLANFYARTADAVRLYGSASANALELTRSVALGLKASGATAAESASAFLQFSQAINSGRLSGEEFRAVYEAAPRLIQAYAQALGISTGRLYELSKAQELTTDKLINVSAEVSRTLEQQAALIPATIANSVEQVSNAFGKFISDGANVSGLVGTITAGLKVLADNIDIVVIALLGLSSGAIIGGLIAVSGALLQAAKAAAAFSLASWAATNPLAAIAAGGAIAVGLTTIAVAFDKLTDSANDTADAVRDLVSEQKKLNDALGTAEIRLVDARRALKDFDTKASVDTLKKSLEDANEQLQIQNRLVDALRKVWTGAIAKANEYREKAKEIAKEAVYKGTDRKRAGLSEEQAQLDASIESGQNYLKIQQKLVEAQKAANEGDISGARKLAEEADRLTQRQTSLIDQLKASDAEGAARRIAAQTAQLYEVLAQIEDAQARLTGEKAKEEEDNLAGLEIQIDNLKAQIEEIKKTDLRLERVTLVEQLDTAIAKVAQLKADLAGLSAPEGASPLFQDVAGSYDQATEKLKIGGDDAWAKFLRKGQKKIAAAKAIEVPAEPDFSETTEGRAGIFEGQAINVPAAIEYDQFLASVNEAVAKINANIQPIVVPTVISGYAEDGRPIVSANQAPAFASGGAIKPPNAVDNLLGWFNKDEFILKARSARSIGLSALNFMNEFGRLPNIPAFASGGPVGTPINIHLDGHSYPMTAQPSVAKELGRLLGNEVLKRGRR